MSKSKLNYEVWLMGYDAQQNITDFELMLYSSEDAADAINYAIKFRQQEQLKINVPNGIKYLRIEVETVATTNGDETNIESIYYNEIIL